MPVDFQILPDRGLVVIWFSGFVTLNDIHEASVAYVEHPDYCAGQKQLVDMASITGYDIDSVGFMEMQANKAKRLGLAHIQSLVVYIAPTPISQEVSAMFIRTWDGVDAVVPMSQTSQARALALLGQREDSIEQLLSTSSKNPLKSPGSEDP